MIRKATLALFCCFWTAPARAQFDLLLKGGHLIDPKNNINQNMDLAILVQNRAQAGIEELVCFVSEFLICFCCHMR